MKPLASIIAVSAAVLLGFGSLLAGEGTAQAAGLHKWKFPPTVNAPWARQEDDEELDTPLAAAGLCRSTPFNTTVAYGPLGSNVDVIVGDPVNNSGFSNFGCTTPQNETAIAVNPINPANLIAGANDYRVCCDFTGLNDATGAAYYSFDGGATWGNVMLHGLTAETGGQGVFAKFDSAGDPSIAFGADGIAYYANLVFSRVSPATGVAVSVSFDGGVHWSEPNLVSYNDSGNYGNDKEWIAAGSNGKVVVTWTQFATHGKSPSFFASPIVGAISYDHGKTWSRQGFPVSDAAHPFNQGSQVQFAADGALYVAYESASPTTGYATDVQVLARSTDDGHTFQTVELARVFDDFDCYPMFAGRQTLSDMRFRINSYPSMSIDPVTKEIALVWADNEGSGSCGGDGASFSGTTSNQVKLIRGAWPAIASAPVVDVTTSAPDKVYPSVALANGKIAIVYYTRDYAIRSRAGICHLRTNDAGGTVIDPSESANSVCIDYAGRAGGAQLGRQIRLSTESSNPYIQFADGAFIGDYTQVAITPDGKRATAAWTDFRGRPGVTPANQDVMVQSFAP
jgi:hypothetical protein